MDYDGKKLHCLKNKEHSEKERLYLILKDTDPIEFDWFISSFIDEFEEIFNQTTACCKEYLKKTNNKNEMLQERIIRKNNTQLLRHIHKLLAQLGQFDVYEPRRRFVRI